MNTITLGLILIHMVTLSHLVRSKNHKYASLDGHLKEISTSQSHVLGTQIHLFKVVVLPNFTYGTKIWGGDLKNSHLKSL